MTGAGPGITEMTLKSDKTRGYREGIGYIPGDIPGHRCPFHSHRSILTDAEVHRG